MNTLIVYDTQFGNTEKVAMAIATALERHGSVRALSVNEARDVRLDELDLLVIGGPTQGHRARKVLRDWIDQLDPEALRGVALAAFDTRLPWPMIFSGSAAHSIANVLRRHHGRLVRSPESFIVKESEGPLAEGELQRAAAWAETLAVVVEPMAASTAG